MLTILLNLALLTTAQAAEPPCDATASGPIGSAHYCTDANGNATCTLIMDIPFVGIIETTVTAANESECNDYVTASSNAPSTPDKNAAKAIRMEVETPDANSEFVDLNNCTVDLADTQDRMKMVESAFGVPEDYEIIAVFESSDDKGTETCIEASPKGGGGGTAAWSVNYLHCFLTAY